MAEAYTLSAILASTIPEEHQARYLQEFKRIDADGSGRVSSSEIQSSAAALGHALSEEDTKEVMASIDVDADGTVTFEEFCKVSVSHVRVCGWVERPSTRCGVWCW